MKQKWIALILAAIMTISMAMVFVSCAPKQDENEETSTEIIEGLNDNDDPSDAEEGNGQDQQTDQAGNNDQDLAKLDMSAWKYNKKDDVFYQIGIPYCSKPVDETLEALAVFVPGPYMGGKKNGDGTYTCKIRKSVKVSGYTAQTAPIVMPIDTPGYSSQAALTDYTDVSRYTKKGFVYVHAGCRGKEAGAPSGVTDIKAAVRFLRYTGKELPGDEESIFTFGMSGGGAQSAIMGSTGNDSMYAPYLKEIGAVTDQSDAVLGCMCWCPITNLDTADAAYEWMMGSTRSELSDDEQKISDKLAEEFVAYMNRRGFRDEKGAMLTLVKSDEGIYQAGPYYDYMKSVIQKSLNDFLKKTEFPYKAKGTTAGGLKLSGTYETPADYIKALNKNGKWVKYNSKKKRAKVTNIEGFVKAFKPAGKGIGAFDDLDRKTSENILFGYGVDGPGHFDFYLAEILNGLKNRYTADFAADFAKEDRAGTAVDARLEMYTPLYYLLPSESGYKSSEVASFWRIRSGIEQTDCALTTEVNLALALKGYKGVKSVDFATVWGKGHVEAEKSGKSSDNFIKWVNKCMKNK